MKDFAQRWLLLAVCAAIWQVTATAAADPFFPPPSVIFRQMYDLARTGATTQDVLPSLIRLSLGFTAGALIGVVLGIALGRSRWVHELLDPVLQFFRAIPPPTLVPVFVVLFSIGPRAQVASIVFSVVWPVLLNAADGARTVEPLRLETARAFRLTGPERLAYVIVPASLPKIFAGLRLALSLSLILMVFSELQPGAANGIGFRLQEATTRFDYETVWAAIVLLGVLGYLFNAGLQVVERQLWKGRP